MRLPVRFCAAYTPHTMRVRYRSLPLNSSARLGSLTVFSRSTVRRIMATASVVFSLVLRPRRATDFAASSRRPLRTSHQGDSGARNMRIARGVGNIHWSAMGTLDHECR